MTIKGQESSQQQKTYKLKNYDISIVKLSNKTLSISVLDLQNKIQFFEKELILQQIGTSTVSLALQGKRKQVSVQSKYKKQGQIEVLQLHFKVQSLFLKTIQEIIYIKKIRNISDSEILTKQVNNLSLKLKNIKELNQNVKGQNCYHYQNDQKYYNSAIYDPLISITLPKGKYILTFSFLLKAGNTWIYIYLNQGQTIMTNCGYYVPNGTNWIPYTIRKVYQVVEDKKQISFTTYCSNSYPVTLKNRIVTAQPLNK